MRQGLPRPAVAGSAISALPSNSRTPPAWPKPCHVAAPPGCLCYRGALPGSWVGASAGPALWGSQLQGPSVLWQPACPLPLSNLAGPALLASGHQDPPQHEEVHQGEGVPPTSFPPHHDCVSFVTGTLFYALCTGDGFRLNSDELRKSIFLPQSQKSPWTSLSLMPCVQSTCKSYGLYLQTISQIC